MTIFFQDQETAECLLRTEDSSVIPDVGESVMIENKWYEVVERTFYYKHLTVMDDNSCTLWVKSSED